MAARRFEVDPGPVADGLIRAEDALARSDAVGVDAAYQQAQAAALASGDVELWSALIGDQVAALRKLGRLTLAMQRCDEYLAKAVTPEISVLLQRAEIRGLLGHHTGAGDDAAKIRDALRRQPDSLTVDQRARLYRVQGLCAADRGEFDRAVRELDAAVEEFRKTGNEARVAVIEDDKRDIEVQQCQPLAVSMVLSGPPPQTVPEYRRRAMALRCQSRYEEAADLLWRCQADDSLDRALRWQVRYELVVLLVLSHQTPRADEILELLRQDVTALPDPVAGREAIARLTDADAPGDACVPQFHRRVQHARRLIMQSRLEEAECLVGKLDPQGRPDREIALWRLAAGELQLAKAKNTGIRSYARASVCYLSEVAAYAATPAVIEDQVRALRSLGDAFVQLDNHEKATTCWDQAQRLEEEIAGRQQTDKVRREMLEAVATQYDERIRIAAEKLNGPGVEATAEIVVAMEAARGAAILKNILPDKEGLARDLPRPGDFTAAWHWVRDITGGLPADQVVWLLHSADDRVYHAVVGRKLLYYRFFSTKRSVLNNAIRKLKTCWANSAFLEPSISSGEFDESLREVAELVGIHAVISTQSLQQVQRIAIVAGGELSDIPFAALAAPGQIEPLGLRYALSDLPCLSARLPLCQRSRRLRGDRLLLVRPPAKDVTPTAGRRADLDGEAATVAALRDALGRRRHRLVRIDTHGEHRSDNADDSWLQLAPEGPSGQLRADQLQRMDLGGCGTLVLGACESGMAQRIGPDERIGFVRAGITAGAAAVLAARWVAADKVATTVLDRFERYLRYLPRDLALQQAQRDVYRRAPGTPADVADLDHPAFWACWTLYGDAGWQTAAGPIRRWLRRTLDQGRRHAAQV